MPVNVLKNSYTSWWQVVVSKTVFLVFKWITWSKSCMNIFLISYRISEHKVLVSWGLKQANNCSLSDREHALAMLLYAIQRHNFKQIWLLRSTRGKIVKSKRTNLKFWEYVCCLIFQVLRSAKSQFPRATGSGTHFYQWVSQWLIELYINNKLRKQSKRLNTPLLWAYIHN